MEKREVVVDSPVTAGGVTVIPVVKVSLHHWRGKRGTSFYGEKRPVSLVVVTPSARRAFRITGEEIALEQLMQEVPDIAGVLGAI
ncbi:MAG: hypothetical protein KKF26_00690 [Chloroflexi bacterium]|nr:hypothetical protein [Chloroflexota bacterium]